MVLAFAQSNLISFRTPHESLPLQEAAQRQFFRIVTSQVFVFDNSYHSKYFNNQVSLWYADHSTVNPLGVRPDPAVTQVVTSKRGWGVILGHCVCVTQSRTWTEF